MAKDNKPSHPLISCGNSEEEKYREAFRQHVKKLTTPIFNKVLQETKKNHMSGGVVGSDSGRVSLFRPHNYRLFFDFSASGFVPPVCEGVIKPTTGSGVGYRNIVSSIQYKVINSKDHEFRNYYGCRIVVRRKTIEVNPVDFTNEVFEIREFDNPRLQIEKILSGLLDHCFNVLKCFIEDFGGSSNYTITNSQEELKVSMESGISLIDRRLKFHAELVKKVYNDDNVEFKDPMSVVNYLQNRAIENIAPEIALAINNLAVALQEPLVRLKGLINSYDDLLVYKDAISCLPERDRLDLGLWYCERFGGVIK